MRGLTLPWHRRRVSKGARADILWGADIAGTLTAIAGGQFVKVVLRYFRDSIPGRLDNEPAALAKRENYQFS